MAFDSEDSLRNLTSALQRLGRLGRLFAPGLTNHLAERRFLKRETVGLRSRLNRTTSLDEAVAVVLSHPAFRAEQKPAEIIALLRMLVEMKPKRLCEIGTRRGGTLTLFAHTAARDASILSMDIAFSKAQSALNPRLCLPQQRVECWRADSHDLSTPARVSAWFGGEPLDFLFIDGDHSYDGVRLDYELFSPLVRPEGLIAFHDIVPDFHERGMGKTSSYSGGVHRFWQELRVANASAVELVDNPDQDGFGLGVVRVVRS